MLRCYDSDTQNQEGESSLHAHFACKPDCSTTFRHEEKHLHGCCARNGAQKISDSFKTAEDRLALPPSAGPIGRAPFLLPVRGFQIRGGLRVLPLSGPRRTPRGLVRPCPNACALPRRVPLHAIFAAKTKVSGAHLTETNLFSSNFFHSYLNATSGSIREARRAGR